MSRPGGRKGPTNQSSLNPRTQAAYAPAPWMVNNKSSTKKSAHKSTTGRSKQEKEEDLVTVSVGGKPQFSAQEKNSRARIRAKKAMEARKKSGEAFTYKSPVPDDIFQLDYATLNAAAIFYAFYHHQDNEYKAQTYGHPRFDPVVVDRFKKGYDRKYCVDRVFKHRNNLDNGNDGDSKIEHDRLWDGYLTGRNRSDEVRAVLFHSLYDEKGKSYTSRAVKFKEENSTSVVRRQYLGVQYEGKHCKGWESLIDDVLGEFNNGFYGDDKQVIDDKRHDKKDSVKRATSTGKARSNHLSKTVVIDQSPTRAQQEELARKKGVKVNRYLIARDIFDISDAALAMQSDPYNDVYDVSSEDGKVNKNKKENQDKKIEAGLLKNLQRSFLINAIYRLQDKYGDNFKPTREFIEQHKEEIDKSAEFWGPMLEQFLNHMTTHMTAFGGRADGHRVTPVVNPENTIVSRWEFLFGHLGAIGTSYKIPTPILGILYDMGVFHNVDYAHKELCEERLLRVEMALGDGNNIAYRKAKIAINLGPKHFRGATSIVNVDSISDGGDVPENVAQVGIYSGDESETESLQDFGNEPENDGDELGDDGDELGDDGNESENDGDELVGGGLGSSLGASGVNKPKGNPSVGTSQKGGNGKDKPKKEKRPVSRRDYDDDNDDNSQDGDNRPISTSSVRPRSRAGGMRATSARIMQLQGGIDPNVLNDIVTQMRTDAENSARAVEELQRAFEESQRSAENVRRREMEDLRRMFDKNYVDKSTNRGGSSSSGLSADEREKLRLQHELELAKKELELRKELEMREMMMRSGMSQSGYQPQQTSAMDPNLLARLARDEAEITRLSNLVSGIGSQSTAANTPNINVYGSHAQGGVGGSGMGGDSTLKDRGGFGSGAPYATNPDTKSSRPRFGNGGGDDLSGVNAANRGQFNPSSRDTTQNPGSTSGVDSSQQIGSVGSGVASGANSDAFRRLLARKQPQVGLKKRGATFTPTTQQRDDLDNDTPEQQFDALNRGINTSKPVKRGQSDQRGMERGLGSSVRENPFSSSVLSTPSSQSASLPPISGVRSAAMSSQGVDATTSTPSTTFHLSQRGGVDNVDSTITVPPRAASLLKGTVKTVIPSGSHQTPSGSKHR